ncbi:hypothetical protein BU14_2194s0001 [Porphyra umbilicalis]|uniref:26S proteasome complex subunit DSS1 n=1 Tax=Porphyra umbilicalis TaxID=2786 RepID=A0A1X6NJN6_PORUM|nr:hypothetical protein BU14_2194s0001 [Porphyra umbilicalis]|eukprot:OSX68831.1 hypothetical protein BU14_2194s0001 [Porphyra umbilicalis]
MAEGDGANGAAAAKAAAAKDPKDTKDAAAPEAKAPAVDEADVLEEDDDFEEFEEDRWVEAAATADGATEREWQDDWDDEAADDDFVGRLRAELAAHVPAATAPAGGAAAAK